MNNRKVLDTFKVSGNDKRRSLLLSEIVEYCKSSLTVMFNTTTNKPAMNAAAKATSLLLLSVSSGQSSTKLPLLNESPFVEMISPIIWTLLRQLLTSKNNSSIGISVETLMSTILESEASHDHILALTKSVCNYCLGENFDQLLADKSIIAITQAIQVVAQNCAQVSNASSRMKVRMKCAKILLDMAAVAKHEQVNSDWIALIIRNLLVSKEDLPHVCMELTMKISKDTVSFLLKHVNKSISSATVQSNWLLGMLPPPILLSALDCCMGQVDSLESTISHDSFLRCNMMEWTKSWMEVLRLANVLLLHLISKPTAEKNSALVITGTNAFIESVLRALESLKTRCNSCSEEIISAIFQKAFSFSVSGLVALNAVLVTEEQGTGGAASVVSDGRQALKKPFVSIISSLSSWSASLDFPQEERASFLRFHRMFIFLLWQCKRGPEFRMYCCEENKVDLFVYLEIRKDAVINGALTAVLGSMIEGDQGRPTWEELLMDLTREYVVDIAVSEHAITTTTATLWLSCLTLMLESQLIPEKIGELNTAEHIFQLMSQRVVRSLRLLDSESNRMMIHPWLQRCIEAWVGWAALPHRRNAMFYELDLVRNTGRFHSATFSSISDAFSIAREDSVDERCSKNALSIITNPPEHFMLEVSSWGVDLNGDCNEYWQELLLLYAAVKYCMSVASTAQPIFAPAPLSSSILSLPLTRAVQFVLLLWSAAKKVNSIKTDFSPEMDSDVLRSESLHYKNQLLLFEKLVRSFLEAIYKLAPSILASSPIASSILRAPQRMRSMSESTFYNLLQEEVLPQLLQPSPDICSPTAAEMWLSLCSAHPRPYVFQLTTISMIAKSFSMSSLFSIYSYETLLQEPFLLLFRMLPAISMNASLFDILLFITRNALLGSRVSNVPMAVDIKTKTYNTQKSQSDCANNMLIVATKLNKNLYADLQEVISIKILVSYYHKCLPKELDNNGLGIISEQLLRYMRDRIHSLIDSLAQDNATVIQALMKVEYLSDKNICDNSAKSSTSSKSAYFSYFSDHYFPFIMGSNAVLQQYGRLLAVDIETMSSALLQLVSVARGGAPTGAVTDAYERYEPGNAASLNIGNLVQQMEVILLQALSYLKFVISVTTPKSDMKLYSKIVQNLYLDRLPAQLPGEALKHAADKVAQALPTLLQRGYNCLSVFHHARVNYHIDDFSKSILQCLLRTQKAGHPFSFALAVSRFTDLASESTKADSVGLKRLKKHLEDCIKEHSPPDAPVKKTFEEVHKRVEFGDEEAHFKKRRADNS